MTEIEYKIADLINFSSNQKPVEFEQALHSILAAKVSDAIDGRKIEVAQSMFASRIADNDDQEEVESEEEVDAEVA